MRAVLHVVHGELHLRLLVDVGLLEEGDAAEEDGVTARASPIISLDSSKVLARYTDHGLWILEPCFRTPAMPVRVERATAGGLNTHPHTHGHTLPCEVPLFLRRSTAAPE
ncbi:hypothetical protein F7725_009325, partial [Dissostichus mawsoni]